MTSSISATLVSAKDVQRTSVNLCARKRFVGFGEPEPRPLRK